MLHLTKPFLIAILLLTLSWTAVYGQYYTLGNDPGRARWRTITSEHYRLIYPEETDSIARLYLYTLEKVRPRVMAELNIDPRPIPVVLHPYITQSNGVVTWAPKRMELFTSPDPYGSNPDPWIQHLSIHESRHVGQVEHFTRGIYNVFYYLLGEQVTGIGVGLFANRYAMEGDAVIAETELTNGGRGRNADFTKYLRAMYINGDFRNWDKLQFGSFRHYTPNAYVFGYALGSYVRYQTGLADYCGHYFRTPVKHWYSLPLLLDPGKKLIGESRFSILERSQGLLSEMWRYDYLSRGKFTESDNLKNRPDRLYTEFTDPIYIHNGDSPWNGSVIMLKSGMETARKMVSIDSSGRERFIRFFSYTSSRLTYDGERFIYWTEPVSNEAADLEDFSVIMRFDVVTGRVTSQKHRTKYFNPAPSPTGDTVAVAEYPVEGGTWLTLVHAGDGEVIERIKAPDNGQVRETVFDGKDIYCSVIQDGGIGIFLYREGKWSEMIAPQGQSISGLKIFSRSLYFSSDLNGVLNIYRYGIDSGTLLRMTNSEYGADYPYYDPTGRRVYYCEYGLKGYRPVSSTPERLLQIPADFSNPYRHPVAEMLSRQSEGHFKKLQDTGDSTDCADPGILDPEKYPSKRYSKFLHAFRIHSWFPVYVNMDRLMSFTFQNFTQTASLGATLLSQNSLGNITSSLSYGYVRDFYTWKYFHSGHFTMDADIFGNLSIELGIDINERNSRDNSYDAVLGHQFSKENLGTPYVAANATVYYPMNFTSRGWYRGLTPYISWTFNNDRYYAFSYNFSDGSIQQTTGTPIMRHQLVYGISYSQNLSIATSQIYPRWGFGISLQGSSTVNSRDYFGHVAYASGYAYLPGITHQQGIRIGFAAQKQFVDGKLYMSSFTILPRGYSGYSFDECFGSVSLDYAVPVYLGDVSIGPLLYLKRLQLIPFGDYAMGMEYGSGAMRQYYSYGADLKVDFIALRLNFPLSVGMRYARTGPQTGSQNYFGLLFDVSFN